MTKLSTCYCTSGGGFISILYFLRGRSNLYIAAGTRSRFIGFRARAAPFFQVTGRWRSSRVLIYHLPAPAPKSFNKRLRQIPYCGLRAAAVFLLFQPFDRSNRPLLSPFPPHRPIVSLIESRLSPIFILSRDLPPVTCVEKTMPGHDCVISYVPTIPSRFHLIERPVIARILSSTDSSKSLRIHVSISVYKRQVGRK